MKKHIIMLMTFCLYFQGFTAKAQNNYFIDGYHGGIWGHYPVGYTTFISDMLDKNPFWQLNLEIEPVTWDAVKVNDPSGYKRLKEYIKDQSVNGRIEFVNPGYGQSYLFNIQGESVIRQLELGMQKIHEHFPEAVFTSYSSEEPCFTSALPQILKSFGYKYASLKNPNTCWGGYTTAFGGELVNWTGPDGSSLLAVPRYQSESLLKGSTWQTIAWNNSKEYIQSARNYGIKNPVGMCIQDAGWPNGPWLGAPKTFEYKTWRQYIGNTASKQDIQTWNFTQENVQVSLVWGSQILQRIAQNNRRSENKIIMDEKLNAIQTVYKKLKPQQDQFKTAWQNLLLAQHHDSWIVPYNIVDKKNKLNWADQVKIWTDNANRLSDSVLNISLPTENITGATSANVKVYNTLAQKRREVVALKLSNNSNVTLLNAAGEPVATQQSADNEGNQQLLFIADVPAMGYTTYKLVARNGPLARPAGLIKEEDGKYLIHTDYYDLTINPAKGGIIESLIAKKIKNAQFVKSNSRYFNEMRGYFYNDSTYHSSSDAAAKISIMENGPLRIKLKIEGHIAIHPFTQYITLTQGEERIDIQTKIDWHGNPGIGQDYEQKGAWKAENLKKAFYNDRFKLSALFPLNLKEQSVYKNAAFDVLESKLSNTYFNRWDSIKNNVIVNWVDVTSPDHETGMALFTDHTTSYSHGEDGILGLTLQYSGMGLWGRNYAINGPSEFKYALLPHAGRWDKANIWTKSLQWNEPLRVVVAAKETKLPAAASLLSCSDSGYEVSALQTEKEGLLFRIFNASGKQDPVIFTIGVPVKQAEVIALNHSKIETLNIKKQKTGKQNFSIKIPKFGIRTIKLNL